MVVWDEERLLALEVDAIHGLVPDSGNPPALRDETMLAVWAWSPRARLLALGPGVGCPDRVDDARETNGPGQAPGAPETYSPGLVPGAVARIAAALGDRAGAVEGGPCWLFPARLAVSVPSPLPVLVSTAEGRAVARRLDRPANWGACEWAELIGGDLGEWAMAVHGREPVSICHTPAANGIAAEAGIWTRPDFRGRGIATACVAAWSERERHTKDVLFYSTTAANHASQSVARALGLVPLGWIWRVRRAEGRQAAQTG
ncbi:GNAT family N-acetyltransferase [Streptomyces aurantiacus]|uniref:N-acetyltransferase domain-containing protein n=1 Tax=Streptomyces aurantiacus JA 4570 TaxID=1286094 RepID=S3ZNY0_9ACTN|nr:GNAT family N-acetyltransferase [Streptomyces aurantiacus]EPH45211.1 hypothetical protein STRAU_1839 [Streptomyces aurantiacus JA 4570]